jgi:glycosyltransferase involved in cell wall biosynthesis
MGEQAGSGAGQGPSCCAIICAYNEAGRVGAVVATARQCALFSEVVVVDDGSSDATASEAEQASARVVRHEVNRGKSAALQTGLTTTSSELVCFLDADLLCFSTEHIRQLVEPVMDGRADATLGVFRGGRALTSLAQRISPMISGQRCLKRELLSGFDGWDSGFGIEVAINDYLLKRDVTQQIVELYGAAQVMKEEKRGFIRGAAARTKMYWQILREWTKHRRRKS